MPPLHLFTNTAYTEPTPSATQNLVKLFGLSNIAASVARQHPDGSKNKLRKSYKGFISDLPGKNEIPTEHYLLRLLYAPQNDLPPPKLSSSLDPSLLDTVFTMEKTPDTGIPGFDPTVLGILNAPLSPPASAGAGGAAGGSGYGKRDRMSAGAESSAGEERSRKRSKRKSGAVTGGEGSDVGLSTDGGSKRKKKRRTNA
ncbi:mediator of RNA polymerase II transcription subunit 19 [Myxozyma melibiosi]|uniref:Mediator of RNA polymerase II transcription subunit 19 n=1 Tax=Myxozyma melibiosi TaxID=54550 RepID=A0ABR1EYW5_9ASCO